MPIREYHTASGQFVIVTMGNLTEHSILPPELQAIVDRFNQIQVEHIRKVREVCGTDMIFRLDFFGEDARHRYVILRDGENTVAAAMVVEDKRTTSTEVIRYPEMAQAIEDTKRRGLPSPEAVGPSANFVPARRAWVQNLVNYYGYLQRTKTTSGDDI